MRKILEEGHSEWVTFLRIFGLSIVIFALIKLIILYYRFYI